MSPAALPWALAGLAVVTAGAFAWAHARARRRVAELEAELAAVKAADRSNEYRVDRFDLFWYPSVIYREAEKLLVRASPGVPFCRACVKALASQASQASQGAGWKCPGCGALSPESIADTAATDSIMREAVRFFLARRPEYRVAPELERLK